MYAEADALVSHATSPKPNDREITRDDLETFKKLAADIPGEKPLLMISGPYKHGVPELIEAHTELRVVRHPSEASVETDELVAFVRALQNEGYEVAFWRDAEFPDVPQRFLDAVKHDEPALYGFSFAPRTELTQIK